MTFRPSQLMQGGLHRRRTLMLVYFGFTYCPDVCPTDLQNIGLALDKLGAFGGEVQPLFITLDPERDSSCVAV
jgi:cytochrome oxidase Cu insertion factor (SCO1/SenC/PrrC family)